MTLIRLTPSKRSLAAEFNTRHDRQFIMRILFMMIMVRVFRPARNSLWR